LNRDDRLDALDCLRLKAWVNAPNPFRRLAPPASQNPLLHLPGGIIPSDFHTKRCYPALTLKKQITLIHSEWMKNGMPQTRKSEAIQ
jgi:hypothetical protein